MILSPGPRGKGVLDYFVTHGTAANLLLLLLVLAGVIAGTRLTTQFFPDVVIETIKVSVAWSGAGPEEVDAALIERLEPPLRAVEGVDTVSALAREGYGEITLEFLPGWNMEAALDDVRAQVDEITDLPEEAEDPVITRRRFYDPVTDIVISGDLPVSLLLTYAEELKARLFKRGVTHVTIENIADPLLVVEPDLDSLERFDLTLEDFTRAIAAESGTMPVGELGQGSVRVRMDATRETVEALGAIPLRTLADGASLRIRDVARLYEEGVDRHVALYRDGKPAVDVDVDRGEGRGAITVQRLVVEEIEALAPTLPQGVKIELAHGRATYISDRLNILIDNGLAGLLIVLTLLFLFLSARTAFWVAAGIPTALLATLAVMLLLGLSLNMVSLFALIICLGIVVDDAIVVGEHADHLSRHGYGPVAAAQEGARRMAAPVFAASVTTIIAFSALTQIEGRFGDMIAHIPITVSAVVLASLIESFLILPAHMRHAVAGGHKESWFDVPSRVVNRGFRRFRERAFRPFVAGVVRLRYPVLGGAVLLLCLSLAAVLDRTVPWRFFSAPERGTIRANILMLPGAERTDTRAMLDEMDRALKVVAGRFAAETGIEKPVIIALAKLGAMSGRGIAGAETREPDLLGSYAIELIDPDQRPFTMFEFIAAWKKEIRPHPLLETMALRGERHGPGGDAIDIRLAGADGPTLKRAAEDVKAALARLEGVSGLDDTMAYDKPEYVLALTPRGASLGFTTDSLARQLRQRLDGAVATSFARGSREVDVEVRLPEEVTGRAYLHSATVRSPDGAFVPLTEIAHITEKQGFASIRRMDGERVITISGDVADAPGLGAAVTDALETRILPGVQARYDVSWHLGGLAEQEQAFFSDVLLGALLALVAIYLVLAWIFESWGRPLAVMIVIPFGLIGAIWGHWLHGINLSIFSVVGMVGMGGIIVNDAIVLITTIDERAQSEPPLEAIIDGAADRLRAVLLTTLTTVGGLAPLLLEKSRQAQFLQPTVISLAYGLGFGLILVLLVVPSLVAMQHDAGRIGRWLIGSNTRGPKA